MKASRRVMLVTALALVLAAPMGSASAAPIAETSGGGWIPVPGGKATFGFVAAIESGGTFSGHLSYVDHGFGLRVHSTSIPDFLPGCASEIVGTGDSNFGPVSFVVDVIDAGEPGSSDAFSIFVPDIGYARAGVLGGGNIQAHDPLCP